MLREGTTRITAILVELGDDDALHPRGGDVRDLLTLQAMGYDVYRVNIHVGTGEIFDWQGINRNPNARPATRPEWSAMFNVRGIRKLELLRTGLTRSAFKGKTLEPGRAASS